MISTWDIWKNNNKHLQLNPHNYHTLEFLLNHYYTYLSLRYLHCSLIDTIILYVLFLRVTKNKKSSLLFPQK